MHYIGVKVAWDASSHSYGRIFFLNITLFFLILAKLNSYTDCKKSCFDKEPNIDHVLHPVGCTVKWLAYGWHKKCLQYKNHQSKKNWSLASSSRTVRRIFAFIGRTTSRNPRIHLMKLKIENNATVLLITWKPLLLKCRRKMFHLTNWFEEKYLQNKVSKIGKSIFQDGTNSSWQQIPLQVVSTIFESGKMSKRM